MSCIEASKAKNIWMFKVLAGIVPEDGTGEATFKATEANVKAEEAALNAENGAFNINVNLSTSVYECETRFLSVALGSQKVRDDWGGLLFGSGKLTNLAAALAPADIRLGGTNADFMTFQPTAEGCETDVQGDVAEGDGSQDEPGDSSQPRAPQNFIFTGKQWETFNAFLSRAGWALLFDVNLFKWRADGLWDSTNTELLLNYSSARGIPIPYFQMGNEPNAFWGNFKISVPPDMLLKDYQILKNLTAKYPLYANSKFVGPDVTAVTTTGGARVYYMQFVHGGGYNIVDQYSLHHYYSGNHAGVADFLSASLMNSLEVGLKEAVGIARSGRRPLPIMLTETASCYGGGAPGISNAYVAGFLWLDKLGLCAQYGVTRVFRQALFGASYALLQNDLFPNPDYYLSVLFKRLIEGPVFKLSEKPTSPTLRVYAHCARRGMYSPGDLVVYYLNLNNATASISLTQFPNADLDLYLLTPGDGGLKSRYVKLNGQTLLVTNNVVPPLPPKPHKGPVIVEAQTFGFIVVRNANVKLCVDYYDKLDSHTNE